MVKLTSFILVSAAIAPLAFAAPSNEDQTAEIAARSVEENFVEARAPAPAPWKFLRKAMPWVRKLAPHAIRGAGLAAKLILRDEEGNVYTREFDVSELTERDFEELDNALDARDFEDIEDFDVRDFEDVEDFLDAREPKLRVKRLGKALKKAKGLAGKAARFSKFANPGFGIASAALGLREFDEDDLFEARDFEDVDDFLESREPKLRVKRLGKALKSAKGLAGKAARFSKFAHPGFGIASAALGLRELEDTDLFDARDYEEIVDLLERDFDDLDDVELEARWKFWDRIRNSLGKAKNAAGKVLNTANQANEALGRLGIREFEGDDFEMEARSLEELD